MREGKKYRDCTACSYALPFFSLSLNPYRLLYSQAECKQVSFVNKVSTLHRHMQAVHKADYLKWAASKNFVSMLPEDTKRRRVEAASSTQRSLDNHLVPRDQVPHYSESAFREVSIRWLIETDQPIHILQNPVFQQMINLASRANHSVKIPTLKQTRQSIIDLFKSKLRELRERLQVRCYNL
ncbi:hypothetical protein EDD15DRAFT_2163017 [Pisolithus albus]|nr:hypothetical protein EDD15DRAFT_2163017 [Pisolithus albus]